MRNALAERLLAQILEWSTEEISRERPLLQAMSRFKYDEYQQYSVGTLFIESLMRWLSQFEHLEERRVAYAFIKNRLIFISNAQIMHLVNSTFNLLIKPILLESSAELQGLSKYSVHKIIESEQYERTLRRSLFIGLSDGARIDQLRRNAKLNNEQVIPSYTIGNKKIDDLLEELEKAEGIKTFDRIFLIDDFTASGTSYFRHEEGQYKGKISKILKRLSTQNEEGDRFHKLINLSKRIDINVIFYMATSQAIERIKEVNNSNLFESKEFTNITFDVQCAQTFDSAMKIDILNNEQRFVELSEKYIDGSIVDRHWELAKHKNYFLGYDECCLPIVLNHNSPNNSLPLLWWTSSENNFEGLFPRITRHS